VQLNLNVLLNALLKLQNASLHTNSESRHLARLTLPAGSTSSCAAAAATDPRLRRRFYEERLAEVSDPHGPLLRPRRQRLLWPTSTAWWLPAGASSRPGRAPGGTSARSSGRHRGKGIRRCDADCPICLLPLPCRLRRLRRSRRQRAGRPAVLLSCSHVFHAVCIATFEELVCDAPASLSRLPRPAIESGLSITQHPAARLLSQKLSSNQSSPIWPPLWCPAARLQLALAGARCLRRSAGALPAWRGARRSKPARPGRRLSAAPRAATIAATAAAPVACPSLGEACRGRRRSRSKRDSIRRAASPASHGGFRLTKNRRRRPLYDSGAATGPAQGIERVHRVITTLRDLAGRASTGLRRRPRRRGQRVRAADELRQLLETAYSIGAGKQRALDVDEAYLPSSDVSDEDVTARRGSLVCQRAWSSWTSATWTIRSAREATCPLYRALLELEHALVPFRKLRTAIWGSQLTRVLAGCTAIRLAMDHGLHARPPPSQWADTRHPPISVGCTAHLDPPGQPNWSRDGRAAGALLLTPGLRCEPFERLRTCCSSGSPDARTQSGATLSSRGRRVSAYDIALRPTLLLDAFEEASRALHRSVLAERGCRPGFKRTAAGSTVWTLGACV
uniref:RING-type domain-containing protein n=1 Tax=Macrostomum lignano TaxID=282301 RepID=A0A1I8FN16_9PLAT